MTAILDASALIYLGKGLISLTEFETGLLRLAQARNMRASELAELLRLGRVIGEGLRNDRTST